MSWKASRKTKQKWYLRLCLRNSVLESSCSHVISKAAEGEGFNPQQVSTEPQESPQSI